jgi:2-polyprenyl-3-methyl-5-hydroxy-6-metoxy-1,4-benzoquinol methylase
VTVTMPGRPSNPPRLHDVEDRARQSRGTSGDAIYRMVARALAARHPGGGLLLDVGCGTGNLWPYVRSQFDRYTGADVVRFADLAPEADFVRVDLDSGRVNLPDHTAEVVAAVETIEHLENPRAFLRELVRLVKPGGHVVVTTPNQLSVLSKLTFVLRNEFNAFRDGSYPAHLTALLEVDLRRIAAECGLGKIDVNYSGSGRVVLTPWRYPRPVSRMFARACSDNVLLVAARPGA